MEGRRLAANHIFTRITDRRLVEEKGRASMRAFGIALLSISGAMVLMAIAAGPKAQFLLPVAFFMIVMGTMLVWLNTRQGERD
jgi:hypothetical protein